MQVIAGDVEGGLGQEDPSVLFVVEESARHTRATNESHVVSEFYVFLESSHHLVST